MGLIGVSVTLIKSIFLFFLGHNFLLNLIPANTAIDKPTKAAIENAVFSTKLSLELLSGSCVGIGVSEGILKA